MFLSLYTSRKIMEGDHGENEERKPFFQPKPPIRTTVEEVSVTVGGSRLINLSRTYRKPGVQRSPTIKRLTNCRTQESVLRSPASTQGDSFFMTGVSLGNQDESNAQNEKTVSIPTLDMSDLKGHMRRQANLEPRCYSARGYTWRDGSKFPQEYEAKRPHSVRHEVAQRVITPRPSHHASLNVEDPPAWQETPTRTLQSRQMSTHLHGYKHFAYHKGQQREVVSSAVREEQARIRARLQGVAAGFATLPAHSEETWGGANEKEKMDPIDSNGEMEKAKKVQSYLIEPKKSALLQSIARDLPVVPREVPAHLRYEQGKFVPGKGMDENKTISTSSAASTDNSDHHTSHRNRNSANSSSAYRTSATRVLKTTQVAISLPETTPELPGSYPKSSVIRPRLVPRSQSRTSNMPSGLKMVRHPGWAPSQTH
mgnify:CR=1 FL=1